MDPNIILVISLWCGVPNMPLPYGSNSLNKTISDCRHDIISCYKGNMNHPKLHNGKILKSNDVLLGCMLEQDKDDNR